MSTGHESGVSLYRDFLEHRDYLSPAIEGSTDKVENPLFEEWERQTLRDWPALPYSYQILTLHLHPTFNEPLELSVNDCLSASGSEGPVRIVTGVGSVDNHGNGDILMLQPTIAIEINDDRLDGIARHIHELYEATKTYVMDAEFAKALEIPGFVQADMLHFKVSSEGGPAIVQNPNILHRYGYSAHFDRQSEYGEDWEEALHRGQRILTPESYPDEWC